MKKSILKKLTATFACALMLCTSAITALAAAPAPEEEVQELVEGIFVDPATFDNDEVLGDGIVLYANFTVTAKDLAPGRYTKSSSTYYIHKGVDKLGYTVSWSPTGNNIRLGFVNRQDTSKQYYITCKGGEETGTMGTSNVPDGEYYVVFDNPSGNSGNVNGSATCDWK
ncbi:hypothetical protein IMSAGC013_00061 [Lachnospiraceae bacterium]|nr:hypothetical protein IMSAGC013_00061 [Lachnospiraceae bacterium]